MKKVLTFFLCLSSLVAVAQAYPAYDNAHEIKLNVGLFLATGTVEGSYEYFFAEDISIGGTIYADNKPTDFNGNFGIGPNFRAYFLALPLEQESSPKCSNCIIPGKTRSKKAR